MITIKKDFPLTSSYPLDRLGDPKQLLFFDIETTGFSALSCTVYLIGCLFKAEGGFSMIQWFAETRADEKQVIEAFFSFLSDFQTLVHFNGDMFDIPFLKQRAKALHIPAPFEALESVDIYRKIKPFKQHLKLENLKQKTIERFLSIDREDLCSGGDLIPVYQEYGKTRDEDLLHLLLLHNEDDLKGMPSLLPILFYPDFFTQDFALESVEETGGETSRVVLTLRGQADTVLPVPVSGSVPSYAFRADKDTLALSLRLYQGTLKYYYPNYKDYYYLIYEDTAIHKSVGEYVDKDAKVRATKETCYTKKQGLFLPQPSAVWTPDFKNSCRDKNGFFEFSPDCFSDHESLNAYAHQVIKAVFGANSKKREG